MLLVFGAAALVAGCGAPGAGPVATPGRVPAATAAADSLAGPWQLRNLGRPRSQRVTLLATLRSQVDTLVREDTLASETLLEWSSVPGATPPRVVGMVRGFAVRMGADTSWRALADPPMPVSFMAAAPGAALALLVPADSACDARAAVVQALRETWFQPPARLAAGTEWRDSSAYVLCRDGILLQARSVRRYVVEGAGVREGRLVLRVRRESRTALSGRGLQFGDSVAVTGAGDATALLELSPDGAAIVAGTGSSELRLTLQGRRRTQQLVQHGALEIRAP